MTFDLDAVRSRFPALARTGPDGRPVVHADAPGGTQVVDAVIDAMVDYLRTSNANSRGDFVTSSETDRLCAQVRRRVAGFVGGAPSGIVFGPNMTTLTWHFARAFGRTLGPGERIVATESDHDANVSPWLSVAEDAGAEVRLVPLDPASGVLRLDALEDLVTDGTRLVAFPGASNALGTVVPPGPFVAAARRVGALTFCDAVHAAPHVPLDQAGWGVDVLACSPYKFYGPHAGLLSADPALLARLTPDTLRPAPDSGPERWQTGTAAFEAIAGVGAAIGYLEGIGMRTIGDHERTLSRRFLDGLAGLPAVTVHGPTDPAGRTPTFAVTVDGRHPDDVARHLAERGIFAWSGHYYALEPMRALGLLASGGAVRIGFAHYHGPGDVDRVLDALAELA